MSQSPQSPEQDDDFSTPWQPSWHGLQTQPFVVRATRPVPSVQYSQQLPTLPTPSTSTVAQETHGQRFRRRTRVFFKAVLRRVYQLLALALLIDLLLLLSRFLLHFFGITTSIFTSWVYQVTSPIVYPFDNLVSPIAYNGFSIDITSIITAVASIVVFFIVRRLLQILFGK